MMFKRCTHDWQTIKSEHIPSPLDKLGSKGTAEGVPMLFYQSTDITILACKKCGKLDKTIVRCPA